MLIRLAESREEKGLKILKSVCGLALFGVPNHGMPIASLVPMAGNGPNRFLLESISDRNPQNLADQHERFLRALESARDTEIVCFYETLESPTAQEVSCFSHSSPKLANSSRMKKASGIGEDLTHYL